VRGEAGIGKSALVSRFLDDVANQVSILVGECDDLLTPQSLGPVWDVARDEASLQAPLRAGNRRAVMDRMLGLLCRKMRPTVLVFEDMQWADDATLDVTRFLGRRVSRVNGLVVLTYRDGEVDTFHPLRLVIGAIPSERIHRIQLHPLSRNVVAAMVGDTRVDVDEVMALSGGNPLLVGEMLAWGTDPVPLSVRDSVLGRAARLSAAGREVLDVAAVLPGGANPDVLDQVLGDWQDELHECSRLGFLAVRGETVAFCHELVRRAVEVNISQADRRELNRRVLAALGEGADPAVVLHHAREAGDVEAIVTAAPLAIRDALAVESRREALQHFRTLEPYLDRLPSLEQADLLADWARVEDKVDQPAACEAVSRAIELYRTAGTDRELACVLTLAIRIYELGGRHDVAEAVSAECVEILRRYPPSSDLADALSRQAWLAFFRQDDASALESAEEAIRIGEATGGQKAVIDALDTKGLLLFDRSDPAGLALLEESRRRAERLGYPDAECRALVNLVSCVAHFDLEWAEDLARRLLAVAARHEMPLTEAHARMLLAWLLLYRGDWEDAGDEFGEVLTSYGHPDDPHHHALGRNTELSATAGLAMLHMRMGRPDADAMLRRTLSLFEAVPWPNVVGTLLKAEYLWLTGEQDADIVATLLRLLEETPPGQTGYRGPLARWLWEFGDLPDIPEWIPERDRALLTGDPERAAALYEEYGMRYEQALCLMHGDEDAQLDALRILEDLGAAATADKLKQALHEGGVRIPRGPGVATRRHPAGLTARQAEVLKLLAADLSNAEIADRLFISPHTAKNHVAAILTKLEVTGRQAAVDAARERGLIGFV
jgi:DNA-binding CsgD family transcriptional regulator